MATRLTELHDEDFYAWAQAQARALREHFKGDHRLDVEHLAEAIEDLDGSELQAVDRKISPSIRRKVEAAWRGSTGEHVRSQP